MKRFDVFNGDADGICALHQLRLAIPADAALVTGVKRDINLLARVDARAGDVVTVLDVSADVNHAALVALLDRGVHIEYFDHHFAGELPVHAHLRTHIDTSSQSCTSLLMDRHLEGLHSVWAIVGAYGDNLREPARERAAMLGLHDDDIRRLRELGEDLSYNAYGDCEADLIVHPAELYRSLRGYVDPFAYMREVPVCRRIAEQKRADLEMAKLVEPELALAGATIYILPDDAWTRRVRGVFANELANRFRDLAHAVMTRNREGGYTVSVRSPLTLQTGADAICRKFPSGGGRLGAAGINHLPRDQLPAFVRELDRAFPAPSRQATAPIGERPA
jgi:hypothetical protein